MSKVDYDPIDMDDRVGGEELAQLIKFVQSIGFEVKKQGCSGEYDTYPGVHKPKKVLRLNVKLTLEKRINNKLEDSDMKHTLNSHAEEDLEID